MITRTVRTQLIAFAALTAVGVSYVGAEYAGLADRLLDRGYSVRVDFGDSGGIYKNAEVTYRGVPVGRVGELELAPHGGVFVQLNISDDTPIPADTVAVVANRSAVGEQYVDLQPRTDQGPYLRQGSTIEREDTRTPLPETELISSLDRMVQSVGRKDLRVTVDELGKAFSGTGPDLSRLVNSGDRLVESADRNLPETVALIEDSRKALKTQVDKGSAIKSFSRDLADLTETVKNSDGDLRRLTDTQPAAARELTVLLQSNRSALPVLLGNLISGGQVTAARLPGLEQTLVTFPSVVAGSFTVLPGDGTSHFGLVLNADDPPPCHAGYEGTDRRPPSDTSRRPSNTGAHCAEPRGSETSVRGAQNAPSPGGTGAQGGRSGTASYATPYDPPPAFGRGDPHLSSVAGLVRGPQGRIVRIGTTGGAQSVFGKESWQWLLVGPMA